MIKIASEYPANVPRSQHEIAIKTVKISQSASKEARQNAQIRRGQMTRTDKTVDAFDPPSSILSTTTGQLAEIQVVQVPGEVIIPIIGDRNDAAIPLLQSNLQENVVVSPPDLPAPTTTPLTDLLQPAQHYTYP